ncbi:hypothetical protein TRL7639_01338 [Falsiruegeria litorea R37]|uniref:TPM domain-containing protein n=1 Tax=Falsiruegeria litorea R37 TaxID=1200284 RepID=A0A1Y5S355_9RHOB|nr:TPM domain-containing protein [Falsiruegeria litorea]SLN31593.1 hypothetical protein TRL7639_01338 [Falsiruegeria litorea R37]
MTSRDFRVALMIVAAVVFVGWAIGYGIGVMTKPATVVAPAPPTQPLKAEHRKRPTKITTATGAQLPGYSDVYVNDYVDLLTDEAEERIRAKFIELYDRTGVEMTLLTIQDMGFYGHSGDIRSFATATFNEWGVGNATRNDGVLILISRYDREMWIALGDGYDSSWDARMQRVVDNGFLPWFRADQYEAGLEKGTDETVREVSGVYPGQWDAGSFQRGVSWLWRKIQAIGHGLLGLVLVPIGGFVWWLRKYMRNRPRPCTHCGAMMERAGEEAEDAHLDGGQQLEEYLKSVDYDVWHCRSCGHMDINRYRSWFSGYGACPQCNYRTLSTTSTVLSAATKSSTGRKRVDYDCKHCGHHDSEVRTIPKLSDSSSSGGSSRSSFGGGSSSGGGAGGSW